MALNDRKVMTFDVVGTLIDFETGILDYVQGRARAAGVSLADTAILEAYARAEDRQHHETPRLPFPSMMAPMYREMAERLGLPGSHADAEAFRLSIPHWPAFPDSIAALKRLRKRFFLVAMTNSDNWALSHFARTLELPFDDMVTAEMVKETAAFATVAVVIVRRIWVAPAVTAATLAAIPVALVRAPAWAIAEK